MVLISNQILVESCLFFPYMSYDWIALCRAVLTALWAPSKAEHGAHTYTTTNSNKTVNVDKIKHMSYIYCIGIQ